MAHVSYNPHKKFGHFLERAIYPISLISPLMTIPQLLQIWVNGSVEGVSLATWAAFTFVSGVWAIYGILHKEKPLAIANTLMFFLNTGIVIGILSH